MSRDLCCALEERRSMELIQIFAIFFVVCGSILTTFLKMLPSIIREFGKVYVMILTYRKKTK